MPATVSVPALYDYDPSIFDGLVFPTGLDRDILIGTILRATSPFEATYPDPYVCKCWISGFSAARLPTWQKLYNTTIAEYNMLDNQQRDSIENGSNTGSSSGSSSSNTSSTRSPDLTTTGQNGGSDSVEQEVSAFNSSSYQPREKQTTSYGSNNQIRSTGSETTTGSSSGEETGSTSSTHTITRTEKGRTIPAQDLLQKERDLALFNLYDYIAMDLRAELCLLIY